MTKTLYTIIAYVRRLVGGSGYAIISDTNAHAINFDTIIPREDTVIASLKLDGQEVVATANTNVPFNIASVTLSANIDLINAPVGRKFTSITLTSGSVGIYLS